ncbi:sigma-70 family RNA polymerase sigma factor [Staphylococcus schweitzeri]|uniref:sigma-70 family RNA polymerase sigma factor n=1 Tax=Staphylococcus schweitzeri TaxID=1654388 RepID=UPI0037DA1AA0
MSPHNNVKKVSNIVDENEFEKLITDLKPLIVRRMKKFGFKFHDLEDLYQEILIKIYRATKTFDFNGERPFVNYVHCLITSVKYDYLRKCLASSKRMDNLVNEYKVIYPCALKHYDIERNYLNKLTVTELICQFKHLSAFEKEVMYFICEQYKPREIARLMNVKEKTIYNAIQRCKSKIRQHFKMN